jgi:hypothetical protein
MSAVPVVKSQQTLKANERKWSKTLMDAGWMALPSVILDRQQALGLSAVDLNILMHIAKHWWEADNLPFPGKKSIAACIGVTPRTVQRRIAAMEVDGLIKRIVRKSSLGGQKTNAYDFAGLIAEVMPYAEEAIKAKEKAREEKRARLTRKRLLPQMKIAN